MKLSVIRKWVALKGFEMKELAHGGGTTLTITTPSGKTFEAMDKESTIYTSIRGKKGNPKGLYLSIDGSYSFQQTSQKAMIEKMEEVLAEEVMQEIVEEQHEEGIPLSEALAIINEYTLETVPEAKSFVKVYQEVYSGKTIDGIISTMRNTVEDVKKYMDSSEASKEIVREMEEKSNISIQKLLKCKDVLSHTIYKNW